MWQWQLCSTNHLAHHKTGANTLYTINLIAFLKQKAFIVRHVRRQYFQYIIGVTAGSQYALLYFAITRNQK